MRLLQRFRDSLKPTGKHLNAIVDAINRNSKISVTGKGVHVSRGPTGTAISIARQTVAGGTSLNIARVVNHSGRAGGYYNCYLQRVNAGDDYDTDEAGILEDITDGGTVIVANLIELGTDQLHNLDDGQDYILCWQMADHAEENNRGNIYIGVEWFGRHTFGEW